MLGKKKEPKKAKRGPAEGTTEKVIEQAFKSLPATQKWISLDNLRTAAVQVDGSKG